VYRGGSAILAGDQQQLPPPRPGDSALDDGDRWPAGADDDADPESVLDAAKASGAFGDLSLRWHYRSGHESLIAFANAAFYDGRLLPLPGVRPGSGTEDAGPEDPGADQPGVELFSCDPGPGEAALVAQRVVHHYTSRPALTLGVVTFSDAQAEAIEAAVDRARKRHPDLERFFGTDRLRGFFVKSAAAAQGDERDVLIVSVGPGPDENGQATPDFGVLGRPGGWRGLNVAITRARHRAEIVCGIRPGDIPESAADDGLKPLRGYLNYAAGDRPRRPGSGQPPGAR
jgi:superfamily I DNA and/or RNA helicase